MGRVDGDMRGRSVAKEVGEIHVTGLGVRRLGDRLQYRHFGAGTVVAGYVSVARDQSIRVLFDEHGSKDLRP